MTSAAMLTLAAGLAACNGDALTTVNQNPNAPEHVTSSSLFTNATVSGLTTLRGTSFEHGTTALWVQHYAEIQYPEADLNNPRGSTIEGLWNALSTGPVQDYVQILTQSGSSPNIAGPAMVMRSLFVETMTDLWVDIPYTEANKGAANLTPKYDPQSVVYDSIFAALKTAASIMRADSTVYGAADPVYGKKGGASAQVAAWVKLANSLHARAALRLSNVNADKAKAELTAALAGPVFAANADNAFITYPGGTVANPLYTNWLTRDDQRISQRLVDTLKANNDPRLPKYALPTAKSLSDTPTACDTTYRGFPNGYDAPKTVNACSTDTPKKNYANADYSRPTTTIRTETAPSYIMTYSELLFIKAEAAERGWIAGSAAAFYEAAITASMQQWGVSDADIAAYLAQPGVQYVPGATGLKQIAYEKWVSLFNLETEAYSEWRRLDYPVLTPGPDILTGPFVPTRFPYPGIESSLNGSSLAEAIARQGAVDISGKVWWDK